MGSAGAETVSGPPLAQPKEVVRAAGLAFATDPVYRRVVYVNVAFLAVFTLVQFVLEIPRALEPLPAVLLYFPLSIGQWRFWRWRALDSHTALAFIRIHRRAFKDLDALEKLEKPDLVRGDHLRVDVRLPLTLGRAASRAFYVYSIALTLGVIFSTLLLPIEMGSQVSLGVFALRSTVIAFLTLMSAFALAWIVPPIWLIEDAGVRYFSRKQQSVESVARWYLVQLGPVIGVGAISTFLLIYWVAGFTLYDTVIALMQLSLTLYPASLTATYLYHKFREGEALATVKAALASEGMPEYPSLLNALVRLAPK
ncbi:MAG TPA: hypothetical protein VJ547_03340 [Candidatus Thermoplasmatota archaeon]|nr:hypothetical protein [Candidatus Thermoplasmatota archaeon]